MLSHQGFKKFLVFCFVVLTLAVATKALMIKIPLKQLVIESDAIVIGRVKSIRHEWSLDKRLILSIVEVGVQETMKGELPVPNIILEFPGGTMGELSLKVTDMPAFADNEEVLIFLRSIKNVGDTLHSFTVAQNYLPSYEVHGKAQGKYSIDANGLARKSGYATLTEREDPEQALSLESLKHRIRSILRDVHAKNQR